MRTDVAERYYRFLTGQPVDRLPDVEFGYWPQTIRRWLKEGLPRSLDEWWYSERERINEREAPEALVRKLDAFFAFDSTGEEILLRMHFNPAFPQEIISSEEDRTVMRDPAGIVAERYLSAVDESSIPRFIRFPVESRDDWASMKRRYDVEDPTRSYPEQEIERIRRAVRDGRMIAVGMAGFYGQLRNWMGFEKLSLCLYDDPALVEEMAMAWAELAVAQIRRLPADIPVDYVGWWEDMASKNGPFVSPEQFRRFFLSPYKLVMEEARRRGCSLSLVDCDGNPEALIPLWLEAGVNIMFPLEVTEGADHRSWRKKYGRELLLRGGINKEAVAEGGGALERELERIRPLIDAGGYVPHLDHLAPPNISYQDYLTYLRKKRQALGRPV
ncbi:MAG TPA: uroporphyrinogen decarboxylase family protein [Spirochaetia bacterium]|nr:uroporphyrinogen decarboxylase family protein [Spirochaetia bacterium]